MPIVPGGGGLGLGPAGRFLREEVEDEGGFIQGALETLGRSGWALRGAIGALGNLVQGDYDEAGDQAMGALGQLGTLGLQMASAIPTGGLSLVSADHFTPLAITDKLLGWGSEDLAPQESEIEFSDMVESWGARMPEHGTWSRLAADIAGGIVLDPMSYVGGLAKPTAQAAGRALLGVTSEQVLDNAVQLMRGTRHGRQVLAQADEAGRPLAEVAREALGGASLRAGGVHPPMALAPAELVGPLPRSMGRAPHDLTDLANRQLLEEAGQQLFEEGTIGKFGMQFGLWKKAKVGPVPLHLELNMPQDGLAAKALAVGVAPLVNPFNRHFFTSAMGGALGGAFGGEIGGLAGSVATRAAQMYKPLDDMVVKLSQEFTSNLIDAFSGPLPTGIREGMRQLLGDSKSAIAEQQQTAHMLFGGPEYGNDLPIDANMQSWLVEHVEHAREYLRMRRIDAEKAERELVAWADENGVGRQTREQLKAHARARLQEIENLPIDLILDDIGRGLPEQQRQLLFQQYGQLRTDSQAAKELRNYWRETEGTGLGAGLDLEEVESVGYMHDRAADAMAEQWFEPPNPFRGMNWDYPWLDNQGQPLFPTVAEGGRQLAHENYYRTVASMYERLRHQMDQVHYDETGVRLAPDRPVEEGLLHDLPLREEFREYLGLDEENLDYLQAAVAELQDQRRLALEGSDLARLRPERVIELINRTSMPDESLIRMRVKAGLLNDDRFQGLGPNGDMRIEPERLNAVADWYLDLMQKVQREKVYNLDDWAPFPRRVREGDQIKLKTNTIRPKKDAPLYTVREVRADGFHVLEDEHGNVIERVLTPTRRADGKSPNTDTGTGIRERGDYEIVNGQSPLRVDEMFYTHRRFQPWVERILAEHDQSKPLRRAYNALRNTGEREDFEKEARRRLLNLFPEASEKHREITDLLEQPWARPVSEGGHGLSVTSLPALALQRYQGHVEEMAKQRARVIAQTAPEFGEFAMRVSTPVREALRAQGLANSKAMQAFTALNRQWKGMLTTMNPAHWFRNYLGMPWQALQDPDIGTSTAGKIWLETGLSSIPAFGEWFARGISRLRGRTSVPKVPKKWHGQVDTMVMAAQGNRAAWDDLEVMDTIVDALGNEHDPVEILKIANGRLLKQTQDQREVLQDLLSKPLARTLEGEVEANTWVGRTMPRIANFYNSVQDAGGQVAGFFEDRMRMRAYLELVGQGIPPRRAADKVNKAFVAYDLQSPADYWARQAFPFFRFPMGTVGPAMRAMRDRPAYRVGVQKIAQEASRDEDTAYPEDVARGFSLPLGGGQFLRGLGHPLEAADQLLRSVPGPGQDALEGGRRTLAQLQPMASQFIGGVTERDLYFGDEFWRKRTYHGWGGEVVEALGMGERGTDGLVRVNPRVQALLESLPTSRLQGWVLPTKAAVEGGAMAHIVKQLTGMQIAKSMSEREVLDMADDYFQSRVRDGDLMVYSRHYQGGQIDPELQALLEAAESVKKHLKEKRK